MNDANRCRGRSIAECERYGKPCIEAYYMGNNAHRYAKTHFALCVICGEPATDVHHWPPLGKSAKGKWTLRTPKGNAQLMPALFALCRKHHEMFHAGTMTANWVWDSEAAQNLWWNGDLLEYANSPSLYELGRWRFTWNGGGFEYREGAENGQWKAFRSPIR